MSAGGSTVVESGLAEGSASGIAQPLRVALVAALDRNGAIGKGNALPWHLPDDLRRFKALTLGKPVLMGRRTADSLGRPLPGRLNLVMTRSGQAPCEGMRAVSSLDQALRIVAEQGAQELCVIGGAEIYAQALPRATDLLLTHVDTAVEGADTFFPAYEEGAWHARAREHRSADAKHAFDFEFVDYVRSSERTGADRG